MVKLMVDHKREDRTVGVGGEGGEWIRGLGLGFTNPVGRGECWTCVCVAMVWVV